MESVENAAVIDPLPPPVEPTIDAPDRSREASRKRAMRSGVVRSLILLPAFYFLFAIGGLYFYLAGGGTLGGYGAAAHGADDWWYTPVLAFLGLACLSGDVWLGVKHYRKRLSQLTQQAPH